MKCPHCKGEQYIHDSTMPKEGNLQPCPACDGRGYIAARKFTCWDCASEPGCELAWDSYNLNGECLDK
jgi:DnaJ-class molecular chaperone